MRDLLFHVQMSVYSVNVTVMVGHQRWRICHDASRHGSPYVIQHGADVADLHLAGAGQRHRSPGDRSTL